jgi:phenylalanine-4-hydroxylase
MLSDKPKFEKLNIFRDCRSPFPVQTVQPVYKVTESFDEAIKDLEKYGRNIMKPITTVYNEVTEQIEYDRNIEAVETVDVGPKF